MRRIAAATLAGLLLTACTGEAEEPTTTEPNYVWELGQAVMPLVGGDSDDTPAVMRFSWILLQVWCPFFNDMEGGLVRPEEESEWLQTLVDASQAETGYSDEVYDTYIAAFFEVTASEETFTVVQGSCVDARRPSTAPTR